jgi:flagellar hook-associated protein 3 FlgL
MFQVSTGSMSTASSALTRVQQQVASGVRIDAVSQDVVAVTQASRLQQVKAQAAVYNANLTELDMRYGESDQSLRIVHDSLASIHSALMQSRNGTLGPRELAALGTGIQNDIASITAELSRPDSQGRPLYSSAVVDDDHPALQVQPGQTMASEITLSEEDQNTLTELQTATWATAEGMADSTDAERAEALTQIEGLQSAALAARQVVGGRWQQVVNYQDANQAVSDGADIARSGLMDTDIAKSATDLALYSAQLQAARSMFARIQGNSLFDVLR